MQAFYCDHFVLPLPEGHRFPMEKYRMLREAVAGCDLVDLVVPEPATLEELGRVHTSDYLTRVLSGALSKEEVRRIGFPWSPELVERSRRSVGGTLSASRAALSDGVGVNLAGGTHHAFAERGEGFCVFNDVAVAIRAHQAAGTAAQCAVIDLDVHQGNGTAEIFGRDRSVFTLSVHGENNFPFRKTSSDLDIELPDGCGDDQYLDAVDRGLSVALSHATQLVFYVAGADPYEHDRLGRLSVSKAALAIRERMVLERCAGVGAAVTVVMSGGYAAEVQDTVDIHRATVLAAVRATTGDWHDA